MRKLVFTYVAILVGLLPSLYAVTGGYILTTNNPTFTNNGSTITFSQTISFSNLRTANIAMRFPYIDLAFLSYASNDASFILPVDELGRIKKISISAAVNQTDGSFRIGSNTTTENEPYEISHRAWANLYSTNLQAKGIPLTGGLSFLSGSSGVSGREINFSGSKTDNIVPGASVPDGSFTPAYLNYTTYTSGFTTGEQLFGFEDYSKFMGQDSFVVQLDTSVFTNLGSGLEYEVIPPSFFGALVLSYEIIPEPSAISLLALGLTGLVALRRCRRNAV